MVLDISPRELRRRGLGKARALAARQAHAISLAQLRDLEVSRSQLRAQVAAQRWQRVHSQVVVTHTGPLLDETTWWAAVLEGGPRAHLDGASALIAEGLEGFSWETVRVSIPPGARSRQVPGLDVRRTRRYESSHLQTTGVPRTRPDIAAVRAALWARSDKQAVLVMTMAVQQGLTSAERLGRALLDVRRDKRRALLHATVLDLLGGVRSISEAEFASQCRARGLPEPTRQVVRRGRDGRYYLDVCWEEWGVVVEIDGIQHSWASQVVGDALRQNAITLEDALVLRVPLLGLRVAADDFFAQIEQALRDRGCVLVDDRVV